MNGASLLHDILERRWKRVSTDSDMEQKPPHEIPRWHLHCFQFSTVKSPLCDSLLFFEVWSIFALTVTKEIFHKKKEQNPKEKQSKEIRIHFQIFFSPQIYEGKEKSKNNNKKRMQTKKKKQTTTNQTQTMCLLWNTFCILIFCLARQQDTFLLLKVFSGSRHLRDHMCCTSLEHCFACYVTWYG